MTITDIVKTFLSSIKTPNIHPFEFEEMMLNKLYHQYDIYPKTKLPEVLSDYYLQKVIPHKLAVYEAGMDDCKNFWEGKKIDVMRRLVLHDLSKFSQDEAAYATHNFRDKTKNSDQQVGAFERAWNHHKHHNPHHPEYHFCIDRHGERGRILPMPNDDVVEMVADWIGAGRTYGNSLKSWLPENLEKFIFHPETTNILLPILQSVTDGLEIRVFIGDEIAQMDCELKIFDIKTLPIS